MTHVFWVALGLVISFEGLTYALVPRQMQNLMRHMLEASPERLRHFGVLVLAVGVFVIWLVI